MRLAQVQDIRQQQTQRVDPRQILASEILSLTMAELDSAIEREIAENPALETSDVDAAVDCPRPERDLIIDSLLTAPTRLTLCADDSSDYDSGLRLTTSNGPDLELDTTYLLRPLNTAGDVSEAYDPLEFATNTTTLREHLQSQVRPMLPTGGRADIVRYLIECIDDRGYLTTEPNEIADHFETQVDEVDAAVRVVQSMDPPGVGARDLQECLTLQLNNLEEAREGTQVSVVRQILTRCWDDLVSHREERIAGRLRISAAQVQRAIGFIRSSLTPYPASGFRPERTSSRARTCSAYDAHNVQPDIIFRRTEAGFAVEMTRNYESMLVVAPLWKRLADRDNLSADESMRHYIREHVERAQTFVTGLTRRGATLRRIAAALVSHQQGFLETGNRAFLRPLTRQALSEYLNIDESVISRAVADKWAQLPAGDVVPLDAFFGNANAVREALVSLVATEDTARPYSDDDIAVILEEQGFPLARRTVAKYRSLERILPARLRRVRALAGRGEMRLRIAA